MKKIGVFLLGFLLLAFVGMANATLIGDDISASGSHLNPGTATIGAGVEFIGIGSYLSFDFADSTLNIFNSSAVGWGDFGDYVFSDFDDIITGVAIASNTGFTGNIIDNFSFTSSYTTNRCIYVW